MDESTQIEESFENQLHEAMYSIFIEPSQYMTLGEVTFDNCHLVAQWWIENNPTAARALAQEILAQGESDYEN